MNKIRSKVFETNSSSCHSIVFDNSRYESDYKNKDNFTEVEDVDVNYGEYCWGYDRYYDYLTKIDYAYICFKTNNLQDRLEELKTLMEKYKINMVDVGKEGVIDHQSYDVLPVFLEKHTLEEFIFGPTVLIIDNDNH